MDKRTMKNILLFAIILILAISGYQNYTKPKNMDEAFAKIKEEYPPNVGYVWVGHYGGNTHCDAFAKTVFEELFGIKLGSYDNTYQYKFSDETDVDVIVQLGGNDANAMNLKREFANAKRGDFIVMIGSGGYHASLVSYVTDKGVVFYDCNWILPDQPYKNNLVNEHLEEWSELAKAYGSTTGDDKCGISVYRAKNYDKKYQ